VLAPLIVFALVNSTDALLLQHAGDVGLSTTQVVVAYIGFNVVYAALGYRPASSPIESRLASCSPTGLAVFAVVYIGLGQSATTTAVWVLLPLYGFFPAFTDGIGRAWISNLAPTAHAPGFSASTAPPPASPSSSPACGAASPGCDHGEIPLTISGTVAATVAVWLALDAARDVNAART